MVPQSINIIESHKFCDLLLLCWEGMKEKEIPHCTSIGDTIMRAWKVHFDILHKEMQVCDTLLHVIPTFAHCFSRMCWGKSCLLQTSGLTMIGHHTLHLLHTGLDAIEVATLNCSQVCWVFPASLGHIWVKVLRRHL